MGDCPHKDKGVPDDMGAAPGLLPIPYGTRCIGKPSKDKEDDARAID